MEDLLRWRGHKRLLRWSDTNAQIPRMRKSHRWKALENGHFGEQEQQARGLGRERLQGTGEMKLWCKWEHALCLLEGYTRITWFTPSLIYLKQCLMAPLQTLNKSRIRTNMSPKIWVDFCHMEYNVTGNYSSLIFKEKMYSNVTRWIATDD